jgi:hypothetical protein
MLSFFTEQKQKPWILGKGSFIRLEAGADGNGVHKLDPPSLASNPLPIPALQEGHGNVL